MEIKENSFLKNDGLEIRKKTDFLLPLVKESNLKAKIAADFEKMSTFVDNKVYPVEEVLFDMEEVIRAENYLYAKDKQEMKNKYGEKEGDNLEFLIGEKAELNNWFGENSFLVRTTVYDDWINGVDAILEYDIQNEGGDVSRVALIIDCTMENEVQGRIADKFKNNLKLIEKGYKKRVKYFESQVENYTGVIFCIPVVIGINGTHVQELMDHRNDTKILEKTPAQIAFLLEIKCQLEMYQRVLSNRQFGFYGEILTEISNTKGIIEGVLDTKKDLVEAGVIREYLNTDLTYSAIEVISDSKK